MSKYDGLEGKRFHRWTVLEDYGMNKYGMKIYQCKCDCGNIKIICAAHLCSGHTKSCSCIQKEVVAYRSTKHGGSKTRLYDIWEKMKRRCYDNRIKEYKYYGDRGITICEEWKNNFMNFKDWALSNGYTDNLTIDRIDNNGNYEPNNCQWIASYENRKKKRNTIFITVNTIKDSISGWNKIVGKSKNEINFKYHRYGQEYIENLISERLKTMKQLKLTYVVTPTSKQDILRVLSDIESEFSMLPKKLEYNNKEIILPEDVEDLSKLLDKIFD